MLAVAAMACCQIMHLNSKWSLGTEMGIILKEECNFSFKPPGLCMNVASSEGQLRQLGKLKASRSPRSHIDLRKELQDFISEFGLPSDSVPSLKQLSCHGRPDLANIVRRRGYKAVAQLLADAGKICITKSTGPQEMNSDDAISIEEGYKEPDPSPSVQLSIVPLCDIGGSSGANHSSLLKENHYFQEQNSNGGIQTYQRDQTADEHFFATYTKAIDIVDINSNCSLNSASISLREKAAEFIETGEFQDIEGEDDTEEHQDDEEKNQSISRAYNLAGALPLTTNGDGDKASYGPSGTDSSIPSISGRLVIKKDAYGSYDWSDDTPLNSNSMAADDTAFWTHESQPFFRETSPRSFDRKINDHSQFNVDKIPESAGIKHTMMELHHFKSILHTKELELAKIKQELEKEKAALYLIQLKAMQEVVRVKEIVSQKESQLSAADQELSDLKQVRIEYWGHGQNVELTGSFNGWHHHIPMELEPASEIQNPSGERGEAMWSTKLWLYPGNYEIKFVVDGKWKIDPRREVVVTKDMVQNNVLKVGD